MSAIGIGVIGLGWMGRVHSQSYLRVGHHFPDLALAPRLVTAADPVAALRDDAARRYGFARTTGGWAEVLADPEVAAVSITTPTDLHAEVGVAAARAGKHIWIEKPVGRDAAEAAAVAGAAAEAGVRSTVGFNYRNAPAVIRARELIATGHLGAVTHARFRFLGDYAAHPMGALSWRFTRARSGLGVLGDLMSHAADLARHLVGPLAAVVADQATFIPERPTPSGATSHYAVGGGALGPVENEDWAACLVRFAGGARGSLEASRVSVADQNNYGFEIHGTTGAVAWDFRRMGELRVSTGDGYQNLALAAEHIGPGVGEYAAFQPGAGIAMGYDDLKVIEAATFLRSIVDGAPHGPTLDDAVHAANAVAAMAESFRTGGWVPVAG
ncbi:Gfo/Idh/MocA family oxidoreductase [Phytohabitans sp. ZYX-F-186]|uniref:Gfo/Idh/MocA family oxidoreductase n=1 Tax=Phytohabitans maris TaxID=3071409 RepID=A0ABU0ZRQ8_9ACTN|nr:Gfo/Idh/MocA family oxidoreductase [Phytohabitans sp. ZYX-F-186]MDQ7909670.1 Gfo/Idh/MocA family oxidoreductase [Phytohabitans sp. ZYX-F-186]